MTNGTKVTVIKSPYHDIKEGQQGVIDGPLGNGFGVVITSRFAVQHAQVHMKEETRILYFDIDQIQEVL